VVPSPLPLHVRYVVDEAESVSDVVRFVSTVLSDPVHATIVTVTALAVLGTAAGYLWIRPFQRDLAVLRSTLGTYRDLLPWLLRISFGMPLIGAGFAGYYFSPAVEIQARLLLVGVGFLLLFGLATRLVAGIGLVAYLVALPAAPQLFLANEYVGGLLAIALVGGGRPSADQVLERVANASGTAYGRIDPVHRIGRLFRERVDPLRAYLPVLVRVTLGIDFLFLGISQKLLQPGRAMAVVEKYDLVAVVPVDPGLWVLGAALAEVAVGVALLAGFFTRAAAGVAFTLFTMTLFALPDDPVLAHLSLFGLVSVLIVTGGGPLSVDERLLSAGSDATGTGRERASRGAD